jgi:hypothetical protein
MANVLVANGVTLAESRSLELARANLSNVMGQFAAYGLLQFYFFQHHFPPSSSLKSLKLFVRGCLPAIGFAFRRGGRGKPLPQENPTSMFCLLTSIFCPLPAASCQLQSVLYWLPPAC